MRVDHEIEVPHKYLCRDYQEEFWRQAKAGIKRLVLVWHRRAGKEKTCWNFMIMRAMQRVGIYYYILPDSRMARRILWDGIDKAGFKTLHHVPGDLVYSMNHSEMKISLKNGSLIQMLGSFDVDSLRGPNPVGVVFSEYSEQSPKAWQVISPILRENEGWAVFNFTPKGQNHARDLFEMARHNPEWFAQLLTVEDTKAISLEEIDKERAEASMSEDMIQQEYYCSFTLGIEGSYYAKYIRDVRVEERIGKVPHSRTVKVHTAWDIGYSDSTSIIFFQFVANEIHIIDFYEASGEGLPHYAHLLQSKPYVYGEHYVPHDADAHSAATGLSFKSAGADLGLKFTVLPTLRTRVEDGIECLRGIFPRIWFNEKTTRHLVKCLENYRKEFDEAHNCYKSKPLHDWTSHAADAMRYMAIATKLFIDRSSGEIDDNKDDEMRDKWQKRFGT